MNRLPLYSLGLVLALSSACSRPNPSASQAANLPPNEALSLASPTPSPSPAIEPVPQEPVSQGPIFKKLLWDSTGSDDLSFSIHLKSDGTFEAEILRGGNDQESGRKLDIPAGELSKKLDALFKGQVDIRSQADSQGPGPDCGCSESPKPATHADLTLTSNNDETLKYKNPISPTPGYETLFSDLVEHIKKPR